MQKCLHQKVPSGDLERLSVTGPLFNMIELQKTEQPWNITLTVLVWESLNMPPESVTSSVDNQEAEQVPDRHPDPIPVKKVKSHSTTPWLFWGVTHLRIKALKCKPSALYALCCERKTNMLVTTHHCAIIEWVPRARWLSRALPVSVCVRAPTADQRP